MPHEALIKRVPNGGTRSIKALVRQAKYLARATRGEERPQVTLVGAQRHAFNPNTPDAIDPNRFLDFARRLYQRSGRLPPGNPNAELDRDLTMHFVISFPEGTDSAAAQRAGADWAEHVFGHGYRDPHGNVQSHDYFLAFHADGNDRTHPHMHVVVDRVPYGGGNLLTLRQGHPHWSYEAMRFHAVDAAAGHGIALVATSRSDRGIVNQRLTDAEYRAFLHANQGRQWTQADLRAYELSLMQRPITAAESQRRRAEALHLPYLDDTYDTTGAAPGPNEEPGGRDADELRRGSTPPPDGGGAAGGGSGSGNDEDRGDGTRRRRAAAPSPDGGDGGRGGGDQDGFQSRSRQRFEFDDNNDINMDDGAGAPTSQPEQRPEPGQGTGVPPQGQDPQNRNRIAFNVGFDLHAGRVGGRSRRRPPLPRNAAQQEPGADAERPVLTAESLRQLERSRDQVQAEQRRDLERWVRGHGREMEVHNEDHANRRRKTPEQPHDDARREREARRHADQANRQRDAQLDDDLPHREAGANRPAPQQPAAQQPASPTPLQLAQQALQTARVAARDHRATPRGAGAAAETWRRRERQLTEAVRQARIEYTRQRFGQPNVVTRGQEQREAEQNRPRPNVTTRAMERARNEQNLTSGADRHGGRNPGGSRSNEPRSG
jgi:hypothetical protein